MQWPSYQAKDNSRKKRGFTGWQRGQKERCFIQYETQKGEKKRKGKELSKGKRQNGGGRKRIGGGRDYQITAERECMAVSEGRYVVFIGSDRDSSTRESHAARMKYESYEGKAKS